MSSVVRILDSIQTRAVRLIDGPNLTKGLHSLEHRRRVAGLSLFYGFYHGRCWSELSQIATPKAGRTRNSREHQRAHHSYQVEVPTPRTEAWVAISEELEIGLPELKKKMTSLLATYRKVRQKLATPGKSGSGADDVDLSPVWFIFKAFGFLHSKYKPKSRIDTESLKRNDYTQ
nr:unnamed protein product [Callosobruchus analis]